MSKRIAKLSGEQKKEMFWASIQTQTLANLRDTLAATGIEAHTRNESTEKTSLMEAAQRGKTKSLDTLLDWYERRRELRTKGWIDLKDNEGRTALMLAAMEGHVECLESLLKFGAKMHIKDDQGKTWLELAEEKKRQKAVEFIQDTLKPAEMEELIEEEDGSVLTSTQRNKLKRRELQAKEEQRKETTTVAAQQLATRDKSVKARWDEVQRLFDSFDQLKPLHDVLIAREAESEVDPALFSAHWLRVLKLQLGQLVEMPNCDGLVELQQMILSGSPKLRTLPVFETPKLRVLEAEGCAIESIGVLGTSLEVVNVSNNKLKDLGFLEQCTALQSLNASGNQLTALDIVPWEKMSRLADIKLGRNRIASLPAQLGGLTNLVNFEAEENQITRLPIELLKLKKLKLFTLTGNPIADPKLLKIVNSNQKSPKELFSKLEKLEERESGAGKKKGGGKKDKKPAVAVEKEEETSDLELDDDDI